MRQPLAEAGLWVIFGDKESTIMYIPDSYIHSFPGFVRNGAPASGGPLLSALRLLP